MAVYRECCFPNCKKLMVNEVTFAVFRGAIAPPGSVPLLTRKSTQIDDKDGEPKTQVGLLKFP